MRYVITSHVLDSLIVSDMKRPGIQSEKGSTLKGKILLPIISLIANPLLIELITFQEDLVYKKADRHCPFDII